MHPWRDSGAFACKRKRLSRSAEERENVYLMRLASLPTIRDRATPKALYPLVFSRNYPRVSHNSNIRVFRQRAFSGISSISISVTTLGISFPWLSKHPETNRWISHDCFEFKKVRSYFFIAFGRRERDLLFTTFSLLLSFQRIEFQRNFHTESWILLLLIERVIILGIIF